MWDFKVQASNHIALNMQLPEYKLSNCHKFILISLWRTKYKCSYGKWYVVIMSGSKSAKKKK